MKLNFKERMKQHDGITLIALVITIIVLLILAAVSIATLTGDNGILTRANDTKTATGIAEVKERVQTDILGKKSENNGEITKGQFVVILKNYFNDVPKINNLPEDLSTLTLTTKTEYGSHDIKISDIYNGTLALAPDFDENTLTIGEAINTDKYGWKVTNYNVTTDEFTTGVWRLFYQDNNYAYLITDECVGSYKPSDYYTTIKNEAGELKYQTGADVSTIGQKLNSMISPLFTELNTVENIRTTAWLTDTSGTGMWTKYKNEDAVFAIREPNSRIICSII